MNSLTLQALRRIIGPTKGRHLPSAKVLRESGEEIVASMMVGADAQIIVYQNGFYIYQTKTGTTVYAVDRCEGYAYAGGEALDMKMFEDENWAVRLVLTGEDRLEHNNNAREEGRCYSYCADTVERVDLRDPHDFVADMESREAVAEMLGYLTDKQRQAVQMHLCKGMTQQEMANALGMRQQSLFDHIQAIRKKLKRFF